MIGWHFITKLAMTTPLSLDIAPVQSKIEV